MVGHVCFLFTFTRCVQVFMLSMAILHLSNDADRKSLLTLDESTINYSWCVELLLADLL